MVAYVTVRMALVIVGLLRSPFCQFAPAPAAIDRQDGRMRTEPYPSWDYFPRNTRPPQWVEPFIANVRAAEQSISTVERKTGLDSDRVLQQLAAGLRELGFAVESGRRHLNGSGGLCFSAAMGTQKCHMK